MIKFPLRIWSLKSWSFIDWSFIGDALWIILEYTLTLKFLEHIWEYASCWATNTNIKKYQFDKKKISSHFQKLPSIFGELSPIWKAGMALEFLEQNWKYISCWATNTKIRKINMIKTIAIHYFKVQILRHCVKIETLKGFSYKF